jgi:hypothetical protein
MGKINRTIILIAFLGFVAYDGNADKPTEALLISIVFPAQDTTKIPPQEFLESKFAQLNMLPTPSAYEIFYALNPELKEAKLVSPDYPLVIPQTPRMSMETSNAFAENFKHDDSEDVHAQGVLKDSIDYCKKLYYDFLYNTAIRYKEVDLKDSTRRVLRFILNDLKKYEKEVKEAKRAKAIELIKLVNSCCIILGQCLEEKEVSRLNAFYLKQIGLQMSYILPSEKSRKYYLGIRTDSRAQFIQTREHGPSAIQDAYLSEIDAQHNDLPKQALKAFIIAVYLSKGGKVIAAGPEVENRFQVICYPPALKSIKSTHRICNPPATYSYISLFNAPYEFMVFDLRTGRQMKFVTGNADSEIINTENITPTPVKGQSGANQLQIPFLIKE